jgi:glycosidase
VSETALADPSWAAETIWWQVYPLGFTGAPPVAPVSGPPDGARPCHRLRRLEPWLDYAADLGCSGLLLGPIFAALTHGYDTTDHFRIDPRLGDDADFDRLAGAARQRGLRIVLDGVFNHVGRGFAMFARALADGPDSEAAGWFLPRRDPQGSPPTPGASSCAARSPADRARRGLVVCHRPDQETDASQPPSGLVGRWPAR